MSESSSSAICEYTIDRDVIERKTPACVHLITNKHLHPRANLNVLFKQEKQKTALEDIFFFVIFFLLSDMNFIRLTVNTAEL